MDRLTGLIAATHTPMRTDGSIDLERVADQARHLVRTGVRGAFVGGTTGESLSLTVDEREALAARWAHVARGTPLAVIVHVGHNALADSRRLAAHAQELGVVAIAAMAPCFFRPRTVAELTEHLAAVASAAPETPFYYYDIPALTGVALPMPELLAAADRIPTFAGIKYTNSDLAMLQECLAFGDGAFDILFGTDEALLAGLALGTRGAVGSTYNFAAPIYHRILAAFEAGDFETARAWQRRSVALVRVIAAYGYAAAAKSVMALIGVDCGAARLPLAALDERQVAALRRDLEALGFFEWIRVDA